jgi:hypothetical protein
MPIFGWSLRKSAHLTEQPQRVSEALLNYPPYEPPEWNPDTKSMGDANAEYRDFFLENRRHRLEALRQFLAKFNVDLDVTDSGIMAISTWLPTFGDVLVDELRSDAVRSAFHGFESPWVGPLIGLNAVFDLGIYVGECFLSRNSQLRWMPIRGAEPSYISHPIFGQGRQRPF